MTSRWPTDAPRRKVKEADPPGMSFSDRSVLTGLLVFAIGVVVGIGIGSASAVSALTQGAPDVLQTWSGVVALP